MINSQEIIERSVYSAILNTAVALGYSLDPNNYLPVSEAHAKALEEDIAKLTKYIPIYGTGNSTSKDEKITPRIVVNARGFYPGDIGINRELMERGVGSSFTLNEEPYETLDQYIDVHLVAKNQEDLRLLHQILFWSLPQRGYIKPYTEENLLPSGNIFLEVGNFFDMPNINLGILEKIYEYKVYDTLLGEKTDIPTSIVPITSIDVVLEKYGISQPLVEVHTPENNNP